MYCSNCGRQIADDSVFCNYCGTKTENPDEYAKAAPERPDTPAEKPQKGRAGKKLFIIGMIVFGLGIMMLFWSILDINTREGLSVKNVFYCVSTAGLSLSGGVLSFIGWLGGGKSKARAVLSIVALAIGVLIAIIFFTMLGSLGKGRYYKIKPAEATPDIVIVTPYSANEP